MSQHAGVWTRDSASGGGNCFNGPLGRHPRQSWVSLGGPLLLRKLGYVLQASMPVCHLHPPMVVGLFVPECLPMPAVFQGHGLIKLPLTFVSWGRLSQISGVLVLARLPDLSMHGGLKLPLGSMLPGQLQHTGKKHPSSLHSVTIYRSSRALCSMVQSTNPLGYQLMHGNGHWHDAVTIVSMMVGWPGTLAIITCRAYVGQVWRR
jgi:hypothetical protein